MGWSYLWLVWRPFAEAMQNWPSGARLFLGWGAPLGGLVGALLLRRGLGPDRPTLLGRHPGLNLAMALVPVLPLLAMGLEGLEGIPAPVMGVIFGFVVLGYATLEEWGWRGYLAEELGIENRFLSAAAVTCFWYPWHWWFLKDGATWASQAILFAVLTASSLGIGEIGRRTRSVLACAGFHALGNILFMTPAIANQLSGSKKAILLGFSVVCWVGLMRAAMQRDQGGSGVPSPKG